MINYLEKTLEGTTEFSQAEVLVVVDIQSGKESLGLILSVFTAETGVKLEENTGSLVDGDLSIVIAVDGCEDLFDGS